MNIIHFIRRHWLLLALMVIALIVRLWYLSLNQLWPQFSNADDGDYFKRALRLAITGDYVDDAFLIRPPFHVWIFAGWLKLSFWLSEPPTLGVRLIQLFHIGLGVLTVPLCYGLATRLFNHRAGLIFAAFWAIWFPFIELPVTLFSEPLYLFLFTLHLWLLMRFDDAGRYHDLAFAGVVLGMAALTRSPALYALVFAVPWLIGKAIGDVRKTERERRHSVVSTLLPALRRAIVPFAVLMACTLVVVLPWTARNWIEYQRFILIDTLGPINLWLDLEATDLRSAKIERLKELPQGDRQAYAMEQVKTILRAEPERLFGDAVPTFRHIWKAQFIEDFWVKLSSTTRPLEEVVPLGLIGDVLWLVVALAGLIGLLHPATDRPFKLVIALWLLYSVLTVLVFHVEPRYLLPIWLMLALYGAWTLSSGLGWIKSLRHTSWRAALVSGVALGLVVLIVTYRDYPAIIERGLARDRHTRPAMIAYARGDYPTAEREYRAALAVMPQFVDAELGLAQVFAAQGRYTNGMAVVSPDDSRRSVLIEGILSRAAGDQEKARDLLSSIELRTGEDAQRWALENVPSEARNGLILGDDGLDLGYIAGFAVSERLDARNFRWLMGDGEMMLPLTRPLGRGAEVQIELAAPLMLDGPLEVRFDDGTMATIRPTAEWRVYHLSVPSVLAGQRRLRLTLHAPTHVPMQENPQSDDPRVLSVMVHRVAVR